MKEIILSCEVITPLFMGGANMEPEIRTQSIKGIMRYWWRSLKSYSDTKKLIQEEVDVFGGYKKVGNEKKAYSSKVILIVRVESPEKGNDLKQDFNLKWDYDRDNRRLKGDHEGIGYLLFSVVAQRKRNYIKPNSKFKLILRSRDEEALKHALASLWCAFYLGGFGSRSRRGAGSIVVSSVEKGKEIIEKIGLEFLTSNGQSDIKEWYERNIKKCFEIVGVDKNGNNCKYSNLFNAEIVISGKSFNEWHEALNDIGKIYSDFRFQRRGDIFGTAIFGLPVIHRQERISATGGIQRRASPLIFKITKYNEKYYWIVVRLAGNFLPQGEEIALFEKDEREKKDKIKEKGPPDPRLLDESINSIKRQGKTITIDCRRLI